MNTTEGRRGELLDYIREQISKQGASTATATVNIAATEVKSFADKLINLMEEA